MPALLAATNSLRLLYMLNVMKKQQQKRQKISNDDVKQPAYRSTYYHDHVRGKHMANKTEIGKNLN